MCFTLAESILTKMTLTTLTASVGNVQKQTADKLPYV